MFARRKKPRHAKRDFRSLFSSIAVISLVVGSGLMATAANAATPAPVPVNTVAPTIQGSPIVGHTLTVDIGTWTPGDGTDVTSYRWGNDFIGQWPGAVSQNYVVQSNDVGHLITVVVTQTNPDGVATASRTVTTSSAATTYPAPVNTVAPTIQGSPIVGDVLTADPGTWTPNDGSSVTSYRWGNDLIGERAGAVSKNYVVQSDDVGNHVTLVVIQTNPDGVATISRAATAAFASAAQAPQSQPLTVITRPSFLGSNDYSVGKTISGKDGLFNNVVDPITYQWFHGVNGGAPIIISGATSPTYLITSSDVGSTFVFQMHVVSGSEEMSVVSDPSPVVTAVTDPSAPAQIVNTIAPTLTGGNQVGDVITLSPGIWLPSTGLTFTYMWQSATDFGGSDLTDTGVTHTLTSDDIGSRITVLVTAHRGTESVPASNFASTAFATVAASTPPVVVPPGTVPPGTPPVVPPVVVPPGTVPSGTAPKSETPASPAAPFATDAGFDAKNAGTVTAVTSGNKATLSIPDANPGDQVFVYGYSTPTPLGWYTVSPDRTVAVDYSSLPAGSHKLVALNASGAVIGWAGVTVSGDPKLAFTGVAYNVPLVGGAAGAIMMVGLLFAILARRASRLQLSTFAQPAKRRHRK